MKVVDVEDFTQWYGDEHPRLLASLTFVTGDPALAAEVVDEAFVRACERWSRVGRMAAPTGWTYRTALNVLRRRHRRAALEMRLHRERAATESSATRPTDWSAEVWDALRRLPERERTAVALRYVADLSTDEIAAAMRVRSGTVGSTLHAARRHLASALGDDSASEVDAPFEEATDARR